MNDLPIRHFDQARDLALQELKKLVTDENIERAVLSPDIFARIRVVLFFNPAFVPSKEQVSEIEKLLAGNTGPFWGGLWCASKETQPGDMQMLNAFWDGGAALKGITDKIHVNERHRALSAWLQSPPGPPWDADADGSPIVSFYAFKGGTGRSTALAIFAAQRAQQGERVVVVDLDLGAPGAGVLLASSGTPIEAGIVDYWLEQPLVGDALDLRDYYYGVPTPGVIGSGEILVFPAGKFDELYVAKLARLDFTPPTEGRHPLENLLLQIRDELRPDWILLDSRAGISDAAGFALGGFAHLNVLFGSASTASWNGLRMAVRRLGADRVLRNLPQEACLLVQSMVPANPQTAELAKNEFLRRSVNVFEEEYYLADPENPDDDSYWYVRDMDSRDAPHIPVPLSYTEQIAFFMDIKEMIAYGLQASDYAAFGNRIAGRFLRKSQ